MGKKETVKHVLSDLQIIGRRVESNAGGQNANGAITPYFIRTLVRNETDPRRRKASHMEKPDAKSIKTTIKQSATKRGIFQPPRREND